MATTARSVSSLLFQGVAIGGAFTAVTALGPLAPLGLVVALVVGDRMLNSRKPAAVAPGGLDLTADEQTALASYAALLEQAPDAAARKAITQEHRGSCATSSTCLSANPK